MSVGAEKRKVNAAKVVILCKREQREPMQFIKLF